MPGTQDPQMTQPCPWVGDDPLNRAYHDTEWGVPCRNGRALFELLTLEGFQAGLSWLTILRKRPAFRAAFDGFDPDRIAQWGAPEADRLLADPGIVRHRGKIEATIGNARAYLAIPDFSSWCWAYVDGIPLQPRPVSMADVPTQTPLSRRMSKDLKTAGFRFCGPTIVYACMEATGLVNDHLVGCGCHDRVAAMAR